jgi:hypothetical protein
LEALALLLLEAEVEAEWPVGRVLDRPIVRTKRRRRRR